MGKNYWELDVTMNNYGKPDVHEDCEITIAELGAIREWTSPKGVTYMYQKLIVLAQDGSRVSQGIELSYTKGETPVTPDDLNKPLPCRIKVAEDNGQYGLNGRKYTVTMGAKKPAFLARGGGGGYKKDTPAEVYGKIKTHLSGNRLNVMSAKALAADIDEMAAIIDISKWCMVDDRKDEVPI